MLLRIHPMKREVCAEREKQYRRVNDVLKNYLYLQCWKLSNSSLFQNNFLRGDISFSFVEQRKKESPFGINLNKMYLVLHIENC